MTKTQKNVVLMAASILTAAYIIHLFDRFEKPVYVDIPDLEDHKKSWFEENSPLGTELGYPACCIKAFCDQPPILLRNSSRTDEDFARYKAAHVDGKYTGFIPCTNHAGQILAGKITLTSLIQNRNKEFPTFPNY